MTKVSFEKFGQTFEVEVEKLPAESLSYLIQYGWNQSLQDCIAGRAKAVKEELDAEAVKTGATVTTADLEAAQKSDLLGALGKRYDAILAGTVGARVGQPRDELRAVARDMVKAALVKAGKKADKDKLAELVDGLLANPEKRAKVQLEADRRKASEVTIEL